MAQRLYISLGESNTVGSTYTMCRHLQQYCPHPSNGIALTHRFLVWLFRNKTSRYCHDPGVVNIDVGIGITNLDLRHISEHIYLNLGT